MTRGSPGLYACVLLKILEFCTGSSVKSYQCKFGVNYILKNRFMTAEELGKAIQEVIHYKTLRGKFFSVHPELRREGIVRVDVEEKGLHFVPDTLNSPVGLEDEEEKLLKQAIALSLEGADENEEGNNEEDAQEDGEAEEEEDLLRVDVGGKRLHFKHVTGDMY